MSPLSIHSMLIKSLTCSNGEQCCPLAACTGSICTLLNLCNLVIFKCELVLGSGKYK